VPAGAALAIVGRTGLLVEILIAVVDDATARLIVGIACVVDLIDRWWGVQAAEGRNSSYDPLGEPSDVLPATAAITATLLPPCPVIPRSSNRIQLPAFATQPFGSAIGLHTQAHKAPSRVGTTEACRR